MADPAEPENLQGPPETAGATPEPARVFISYASPDAAIADTVCAALERGGISCWIAPRNVVPGEFYADAIVHAIDTTKIIVLILSQSTAGSPHVLREVERASSKRHPVVSLRTDLAPLPATLEYFLNTSHWLDASATGLDRAAPKLVEAVRHLLGPASVAMSGKESATTPAPSKRPVHRRQNTQPISRLNRLAVAVAGVAIAVIFGYLALDKLWLRTKATEKKPAVAVTTTIGLATPSVPEKSIAVLPFLDLSEKHDQEYFSDGLSEELLDQLAQIPELKVASRTSAFYFRGRTEEIATIASRLNVAHVLEGSVRKAGPRIRVTAQLIRADSGYHLWSKTYDREVKDVFKVQDEIAAAVVEALKVQLLATNARTEYRPANNEAYDHYLLGRHFALSYSSSAQRRRAIGEFERSITLDPAFGPAFTWLAFAEFSIARDTGDDALANKAFRDAERGIELAPKFAEAYQIRGFMRGAYWLDVSGAQADLEHALSLDPANAIVRVSYAQVLATRGRLREAAAEVERAVATDPLSNIAWGNMGRYWLSLGDYAKAREFSQRSVDLDSEGQYAISVIPESYIFEHEPQRALEFSSVIHDEDLRLFITAIARDTLGQADAADAALKQLLEARHRDEFAIAEIYAHRGDRDRAFEWLRRASEAHSDVREVRFSPFLDVLRSDPRYPALLAEWKLAD
jgi:TolB-like protein/Tfp pilus assembly protein PilF